MAKLKIWYLIDIILRFSMRMGSVLHFRLHILFVTGNKLDLVSSNTHHYISGNTECCYVTQVSKQSSS